ncbi:hypothetical protein E2F50_14315 [Rhizobium deserti]|uniref:GtrA family protein n=1 Tax=Rhizobium deserti TaxID=2547961 RepID=A0A4R5UHJ1_9HYPH|nr:hypothetical protein [Rhizobium deserti]TDK35415.1 hypothetical protein E2F50_14315 [Rhizobium deserti]
MTAAHEHPPWYARLLPTVAAYWLVTALLAVALSVPGAKDLIGPDNDDAMRLVEVRDLLAGQGWFDLMQYRLGLAGGTLMHWSRLVDLPIALLIRFFGLFMRQPAAEGAAAIIWPLITSGLLLLPLAIAGRRIGGVQTMHIALGLGALFIFTCGKFDPGAIDHHNVQLALAMWIVAMLVDPVRRAGSYLTAGIACALAIAVGAETVPLVAVACLCVAVQWAWQGARFAEAARGFGLSLTLAITAAFVLTVPPHAYAVVTCDNLSFGFYSLSALGGAGLFLLASFSGKATRPVRLALLAAAGGLLLLAARVIAPQCLGDPLGNLDPMLTELWLNGVSEARSVVAELKNRPETAGAFYAVGLFAMGVCLFRILQRKDLELHLLLFALIGAAWAITLIQVRGAFLANLLSILPLSLLITDLRRASQLEPNNASVALAYILGVLASVPAVWGVSGIVLKEGWGAVTLEGLSASDTAESGECGGPATMQVLNGLPPGVVSSPSNSGADIIRFTPHRAISAPYHRNQAGMLTELHIGLANPKEAEAFIRGAGVTIVTFCSTDPQTTALVRIKPDGLYAALQRNEVPDYLQPVGGPVEGFRIFRVLPDRP